MTTWTITPGALHPDAPGLWFGVSGSDDGDPHDDRHYATHLDALHFLFGHKVKMGDTVRIAAGKQDSGQVRDLRLVLHGQQFAHCVDGQEIWAVDELVDYLDQTLQPGDELRYHHDN